MKKDFSKRYGLIDTLRGFALINMVLFHFCYDIFVVYGVDRCSSCSRACRSIFPVTPADAD